MFSSRHPDNEETGQQQRQQCTEIDPSLLASMQNLSLFDHTKLPGGYYNESESASTYENDNDSLNYVLNYPPRNNLQQSINIMPNFANPNPVNNMSTNFNFNSMYQLMPETMISHSTPTPTPIPTSFFHDRNYPFDIRTYNDEVVALAKQSSYHSSLLLQYFRDSDPYTKQNIIHIVIGHLHELTVHKLGGNFLTKLFQDCDHYQKARIVSALALDDKSLAATACHLHGTRVIQKLIKLGKKLPEISSFPQAFVPFVEYMMKDKIGRHVIEQCFLYLDKMKNKPLYDQLMGCWLSLAIDQQGCVSLNESIKHMESCYKYRLLHNICQEAAILSQDFYGTHVVQNVLDMKFPAFANDIVTQLKSLYERLSITPRGSYIVEKCLKTHGMPIVVMELVHSGNLVKLAQDPYGNFVIQEALKQTKGREVILYKELCRELCRELGTLESSPYGRNVAKLLKECNHNGIRL